MRLTQLSEKLNLTVQETSRHLSRLSEANLITKDADGLNHLLPYGKYVLILFPGFEFLSKHREYFNTHNIDFLPDEFITRIGDLKNCTIITDVMVAFHVANNLIQQSKEYIWIMGNQVLTSTIPYLEEAIKRGAQFRLILPEDLKPPTGFKPLPIIPNHIERRTLKKIDMTITISEKEARIAFQTCDGNIDYVTFEAKDERAFKWCKDLYLYFWQKAHPGRPDGYPPS